MSGSSLQELGGFRTGDGVIGRQLGQYVIVDQLGRGGMATVYKAQQLGLDRPVALKILHPGLAEDDVIIRRFEQEARIAANLYHPHILTIYDVGRVDGTFYIAMRFVDGETLGQLLRRENPIDPMRALRMVEQIADALDFAHSKGVLHRDVKPANILVESGDALTLNDFGIARASEGAQLTSTRMVIGTPEYMSPEQARGDQVDHRTDLYALGVLLYETLGGRPPFSAANTPALLYMHVHQQPPPIRDMRPDLPAAIEAVLEKALAKSPEDRFQSGRELVSAAREALAAPAQSGGTVATLIDRPTQQVPHDSAAAPPRAGTDPGPRSTGAVAAERVAGVQTDTASARQATVPRRTAPPTPVPLMGATRPAATAVQPRQGTTPVALIAVLGAAALLVLGGLAVALFSYGLLGSTSVLVTPTAVRPTPQVAAATSVPTPAPATPEPAKPTVAPPPAAPAAPAPITAPTAPPATPTPGAADRLQAARSQMTAGDLEGAIAAMTAIKQTDPQTPGLNDALVDARMRLAEALFKRSDFDGAEAQVVEADKLMPGNAEIGRAMSEVRSGRLYAQMEAAWGKDDEAAIAALEQIMTINPGFRETRQKLYALLVARGDRQQAAGDREGAYKSYMRALEVNPVGSEAAQRLNAYTPTPVPAAPAPPPPSQQQQPPRQQAPSQQQQQPGPAPAPAPAATRPPPRPGPPL
ncbi:MAG: protein kinase [Chloroflexota bacterium]